MSVQTLYTAATGMEAMETKLDVIAHNLANVNTTGFKKGRANFEDLFYRHEVLPGAQDANGQPTPTGLPLALLASVWLAGRLMPWVPGLEPLWIAAVDLAFLPLLALALVRPLWAGANRVNRWFLPLLLAMALVAVGCPDDGGGVGGQRVEHGPGAYVTRIALEGGVEPTERIGQGVVRVVIPQAAAGYVLHQAVDRECR